MIRVLATFCAAACARADFPLQRLSFLDSIESVMLPVLDLDPVLRPVALIGPIAMFRDQALQPELASLAEKVRSYLPLLKRG